MTTPGLEVSALFVAKRGMYFGVPGVDPWDEERDARLYAGPSPVVAHPPCSVWCQLAGLNQHRYGHKVGEDGGCFEAALRAVRTFGGVLEHPAYSIAWREFELPEPDPRGGWQGELFGPGWACQVNQGEYGHPAKKATWLYAVAPELPSLKWGGKKDRGAEALVSFCANNIREDEDRRRLTKKQAKQTPEEFRDLLLSIARSCVGWVPPAAVAS